MDLDIPSGCDRGTFHGVAGLTPRARLKEDTMQKLLLGCGIAAAALALAMITSANAFVPVGTQIGKATSELSNTIDVKRSKTKSRPPGWDNPRGKKKGWARKPGDKTLPPGQR